MRTFAGYVQYTSGIEGGFNFVVEGDATERDIREAAFEAASDIFDLQWEESPGKDAE
jgi:hypothetical protein